MALRDAGEKQSTGRLSFASKRSRAATHFPNAPSISWARLVPAKLKNFSNSLPRALCEFEFLALVRLLMADFIISPPICQEPSSCRKSIFLSCLLGERLFIRSLDWHLNSTKRSFFFHLRRARIGTEVSTVASFLGAKWPLGCPY